MSNNVQLEVVSGNCRVPGLGPRRVARDRCVFTPSQPPGANITFHPNLLNLVFSVHIIKISNLFLTYVCMELLKLVVGLI